MFLPTGPSDRLPAQIGALSGLRRLSKKLKMEVEKMGMYIDIEENVFLKDIRDQGVARGRAEGKAEAPRDQLETKFGSLPARAIQRVNGGSGEQMQLSSNTAQNGRGASVFPDPTRTRAASFALSAPLCLLRVLRDNPSVRNS